MYLYSLNQLGLVLSNCTPDALSYEERVEAREDAEHLVRVLCCTQLVSESSSYPSLNLGRFKVIIQSRQL